jgi:hypothetical protein
MVSLGAWVGVAVAVGVCRGGDRCASGGRRRYISGSAGGAITKGKRVFDSAFMRTVMSKAVDRTVRQCMGDALLSCIGQSKDYCCNLERAQWSKSGECYVVGGSAAKTPMI